MLLHPCLSTTKYVNSNSLTFEGNNETLFLWQCCEGVWNSENHSNSASYNYCIWDCWDIVWLVDVQSVTKLLRPCPQINGVTSENKTIHTPPPPPPLHSKLGCLLFPTGSLNSSTTTYCMERVGDRKLYFLLFKLAEHQRGTF